MKKMYFTAKAEDFIIYDKLSRDGKLFYKNYDDFNLEDDFYNKLFFEAPKKTIYGSTIVKELVTGCKFILELEENKNGTLSASLRGYDRDVKTSKIAFNKVRVDNSIVSGFFFEMENDEELKMQYVDNVVQFMAMAMAKTNQRKRDIEGPDKGFIKSLRDLSKWI